MPKWSILLLLPLTGLFLFPFRTPRPVPSSWSEFGAITCETPILCIIGNHEFRTRTRWPMSFTDLLVLSWRAGRNNAVGMGWVLFIWLQPVCCTPIFHKFRWVLISWNTRELTELHSFYSPFNFGPIIINLPIIVSFWVEWTSMMPKPQLATFSILVICLQKMSGPVSCLLPSTHQQQPHHQSTEIARILLDVWRDNVHVQLLIWYDECAQNM